MQPLSSDGKEGDIVDNSVLELHYVTKTIGKRPIVQPISLTVPPGEVLALCGGNGAGKSTILRMIAGIIQPTAGTIKVKGCERRKNRKAYADHIGYMPDDFLFGQALSAKETILFYAALRGVPKAKALQTLERVGLGEVRNKSAASYSKGMRQRLLFAQALLADPALLLLDEPTNGLDPFWMEAFVKFIIELKEAGQTVVFSTHQLEIAEQVADRVLFLNEGQVMYSGYTHEYRDKYGKAGLSAAFTELFQAKR